jgi:hypothetical protein
MCRCFNSIFDSQLSARSTEQRAIVVQVVLVVHKTEEFGCKIEDFYQAGFSRLGLPMRLGDSWLTAATRGMADIAHPIVLLLWLGFLV